MRSVADIVRAPRIEEALPELAEEVAALRLQQAAAPWFIQLPLGVGLFIASALTCGGFGTMAADKVLFGTVGLMLVLIASGISWFPLPWMVRPLVLVSVLLGRMLIAFAVGNEDTLPFVMVPLELALLVGHKDPLNRLFAAISVPAWICFGLEGGGTELLALLTLTLGGALLVGRRLWVGLAPLRTIAHSLTLGWLLCALVFPSVPGEAWTGLASLLLGLGGAVLAVVLASSLALPLHERALAALLPVAVALLTVPVPGVQVALVVALLGFVARSPALWGLAVGAVAAYGAYFMYELDFGLWAKGLAMIGTGAALSAMGLFAGRYR